MLHGEMVPGSSFVWPRVLRLDLVAQKTLVLVARPLFLASLLFLHLGAIKAQKEACRNEIKAASHQSAPPPLLLGTFPRESLRLGESFFSG